MLRRMLRLKVVFESYNTGHYIIVANELQLDYRVRNLDNTIKMGIMCANNFKTKIEMKKTSKYACVIAVIFVCGFAACSKRKDAVKDIQPVDVHDMKFRTDLVNKLKTMAPGDRKAEVDKVVPRLSARILEQLHEEGKTCEMDLAYVFGSGYAEKVHSGDGQLHDGMKFEDELFFVAKGSCIKDSITGLVQCLNGMIITDMQNHQVIGTYHPQFTVEKGWSLNHYVDFQTAITLAARWNIPIYTGREWSKEHQITPDSARKLEPLIDQIPVGTRVFPGDHFDLSRMTYNGNPPVN